MAGPGDVNPNYYRRGSREAAQELSSLFLNELGVDVNPVSLRLFFMAHPVKAGRLIQAITEPTLDEKRGEFTKNDLTKIRRAMRESDAAEPTKDTVPEKDFNVVFKCLGGKGCTSAVQCNNPVCSRDRCIIQRAGPQGWSMAGKQEPQQQGGFLAGTGRITGVVTGTPTPNDAGATHRDKFAF